MPRTAIVGAGAAGLSLALMLDDDVELYERSPSPGGLCRSINELGFTWDIGPHVLGGIPEAVQWIRDHTELEWVEGAPNNVGWLAARGFVTHPFAEEAIGRDYQAKMWKTAVSDLSQAALNAQPGRKPGGVKHFLYPARGGYQAITDSWANQLKGKIHYGKTAHLSRLSNFDRVIWTAPRAGRYNSLYLETLLFEGAAPKYTAVYFGDEEIPWHRVSFPSNFSPNNAPAGCFSVQGEMSLEKPEWTPHDLRSLIGKIGLLDKADDRFPLAKRTVLVPNAYPVPLVEIEEPRSDTVFYHGRTGGHAYLNLDGVVAASMKLAEQLNA